MPTETDFAKLKLYSATGEDAEEGFRTFRTDIAGIGTSESDYSNFQKIDHLLAKHRTIYDALAVRDASDNTKYTVTDINITLGSYESNMLIILRLDYTNAGQVILGINDSDSLPLKKYNVSGQLVDVEGNDLIQNVKYIIEYLDENSCFVLLGLATSKELVERLKNNFAAVSHAHSASDITGGTLDLSRGGTNATTAAQACSNLDVYRKSETDTLVNTLKPVQLYANSSGTHNTISLSDSPRNYKFIEVYYKNSGGVRSSIKICDYDSSSYETPLSLDRNAVSGEILARRGTIQVNYSEIVWQNGTSEATFYIGMANADPISSFTRNTTTILITHVYGYKQS